VATSPAAQAFVAALTAIVLEAEVGSGGKRVQRGKRLVARLRDAVAGVVGGLLRLWSRSVPAPGSRRLQADAFTGGPVGRQNFFTVTKALETRGLIAVSEGFSYPIVWEPGVVTWSGRVTRYWPTAALLVLAEEYGVTAATMKTDFVPQAPTKAPLVPEPPVEVLTLASKNWRLKGAPREQRQPLPLAALGSEERPVLDEVREMNRLAEAQTVTGCCPPRWKRGFIVNGQLGGRWQALGTEAVYQMMPEEERLGIRINGEPVAEIDVSASHLSIMHGLLGLCLPEGDPYAIPEVSDRKAAKAWVTVTLGRGQPVTSWTDDMLKTWGAAIDGVDARSLGEVICARYPFLQDPADPVVADRAGLNTMGDISKPRRLLALRLQNIEARAITTAMLLLARRSPEEGGPVLSLPVHDSLIVPQSAAKDADWLIKGAFSYQAWGRVSHEAGWTVATTIDTADG